MFFLNGAKLQYVDSYKYLGMFIHVRNDDLDIVRQLKSVILRTNILMRTFSSCSVEVKLFLFKSYCSNFYCSHLWYNFTKVQMNKLRITYNNAMRRLFNLHFRCSASEMFANCNIHSMDEMRRTCIYNNNNNNTFIYIAPYPAGCSWRLTTQYIIVINIKVNTVNK